MRGGLKPGGLKSGILRYVNWNLVTRLLPATTCWDFQMFDAQWLKIKTVIENSSSHMHVARAYF